MEAMLFNDAGIPAVFIETGKDGRRSMARLEDGLCSALDRTTRRCLIYEKRPWICREFKMGGDECIAERNAHLAKKNP